MVRDEVGIWGIGVHCGLSVNSMLRSGLTGSKLMEMIGDITC